MNDRDQKVREHAYRIWDQEGRQEGNHEDHWRRGEQAHEETERARSDDAISTEEAADKAQADGERNFNITTTVMPPG